MGYAERTASPPPPWQNLTILVKSRRWLGVLVGAALAFFFLVTSSWRTGGSASPRRIISQGWQKAHDTVSGKQRQVDGLRNFKKAPGCNFTSLDIHHPFSPACEDRTSLLDAMSGGGRLGWDEPYTTRGCDMQWFTTEEVCDILSRFDHIYLVGDSMLRHVAQALHVLLRADLVDGGRATWREPDADDKDCHCYNVFNDPGCVWWSAVNTIPLLQGDPKSVTCKQRPALVSWEAMLNYPLSPEIVKGVVNGIDNKHDPNGRNVFVMGHGIWNDLEAATTMSWLEQIEDEMRMQMPAYFDPNLDRSFFPRLFVTPSAQGEGKPDLFLGSQNNLRLMRHTREISSFAKERGYEHLGLYNMSVQASSPDGTHATYENNLLKAMFVLNWLNMLDPPSRTKPPEMPTTSVKSPLETQIKQFPEITEPVKTTGADSAQTQGSASPAAESKHKTKPKPKPKPTEGKAHPTKPSKHPIDELITSAEKQHMALLDKRTHGIHAAAVAYRERRGRHPPPRFDRWVKWCEDRDLYVIEDYFDQIYGDLAPFWAVDPAAIRDFPKSWMNVLSIRNGTVTRWEDEPANIANWMDFWGNGFNMLPLEDLPDVDIAFNGEDEPKLFVPYEKIHKAIDKAERKRLMRPVDKFKPLVHEFDTFDPLPPMRPPVQDRDGYKWADFPENRPLWMAGREACPPHSAARNAPGDDDYSRLPEFPHVHNLSYMHEGYVANWSAAKSSCDNPHLRDLHGTWISMLSSSLENPKPAQKALITDLVPMLSGCKIHDVNAEILVPPAMQWPSDADSTDFTFNYKEDARVAWEDKKDLVHWRGSASGGVNDADNWTRFQRHRFLAMMNGTLVSQHEAQRQNGIAPPTHAPGGKPPLPYNFPLPQNDVYDLAAMRATSPTSAIETWINDRSDTGFIHLRCYPPPTWFSGNGADCPYNGHYYTVKSIVRSTEAYKYKYQPDLDGASYSGRYRSILQSNSLPIKATIYDEWHDSRLIPWKHFIPMDNTFADWYGILEYFLGYGGHVEGNDESTGEGEDGPVLAGHDEIARKIGEEGSDWARTVLRNDDMLAYVYRLILELARLQDDRRDEMGFSGDLR